MIVAVDALGFDPDTVITGLSLTGLALGFALKDILQLRQRRLILTLRPFRLGDQIVMGEIRGSSGTDGGGLLLRQRLTSGS